jgi:NTP pyrophosphatase (non-canonical NTP hydrolase)
MNIQELSSFLASVQGALDEKFGKAWSQELQVLSCMTKLSEEVWELAEQIMLWRWRQDDRKWAFAKEDMEKEIADVILSVWMIAHAMDIDLEQALSGKMKRIKEKFNI